jgi:hypothetical protein
MVDKIALAARTLLDARARFLDVLPVGVPFMAHA